ncbi:MAG: hypothetical protein QOF51_3446 [Chloroflexota bacterium]|jgi:DNA-binding phage protein|nr:hypothetical protein [Chloroflexota bacterium]
MVMSPDLVEPQLGGSHGDGQPREAAEREGRVLPRVQELIAALDTARRTAGFSKADLARATGASPAAVRRLLTSGTGNPTLATFLTMLDAVGLDLMLTTRPARPPRRATSPDREGPKATKDPSLHTS